MTERVLTEDFTGTNGDPWNTSNWTDDSVAGGTVDIQSNEGRLLYGSGSPRVYSDIVTQPADLTCKIRLSGVGSDVYMGFMKGTTWGSSGTSVLPLDSYYLLLQYGVSQDSQDSTTPVYGGSGTGEAVGQAFTTPSASQQLYGLGIGFGTTVGSPTDNITARIRTGSMTGTVVATSTSKSAASISPGINLFQFGGYVLSSSTTYYLEIYRSGGRDTSNYLVVQYDSADPMSGGDRWTSNTGTWSEATGTDIRFQYPVPVSFKEVSDSGTALSPFGVVLQDTQWWFRIRFDGNYFMAKMWSGSRSNEPKFWYAYSAAPDHVGNDLRVFFSANPGATLYVDDVEFNQALIDGETGTLTSAIPPQKPARWAANPGMVHPIYRRFWEDAVLIAPLWEGQTPTPTSDTGTGVGVFNYARGDFDYDSLGGYWKPEGWATSVANPGRLAWGPYPDTDANVTADGPLSMFMYALMGGSSNGDASCSYGVGSFGAGAGLSIDYLSTDDWDSLGSGTGVDWGLTSTVAHQSICMSYAGGGAVVRFCQDGKIYPGDSGGSYSGSGSDKVSIGGGQTDSVNDNDVTYLVVYMWNRALSDYEMQLLARDPFGPVRMDLTTDPVLWAVTGTPFTLAPNGDGTITAIFNETGGTTNLYQSVDDDPDSPVTTDWITSGEADGSTFLELSSTPASFGGWASSTATVRAYVDAIAFGTDTAVLYAQLFASDESTAYSDEVQVATDGSSGLVTANLTVNATGLAASKAAWDAARLKLRWDYTA